jgi:hypothetical protein
VVVGETRDQAAHAGTPIDVEYAVEPPIVFSRPIRGCGRATAAHVAARVVARRRRKGDRGRASQDRNHLYDAGPRSRLFDHSPRVKHVLDVGGRYSLLKRYKPPEGRRPAGVRSSVGRHRTPRKQRLQAPLCCRPQFWCSRATRSPYFPRVSAARDKPPSYRRLAA